MAIVRQNKKYARLHLPSNYGNDSHVRVPPLQIRLGAEQIYINARHTSLSWHRSMETAKLGPTQQGLSSIRSWSPCDYSIFGSVRCFYHASGGPARAARIEFPVGCISPNELPSTWRFFSAICGKIVTPCTHPRIDDPRSHAASMHTDAPYSSMQTYP